MVNEPRSLVHRLEGRRVLEHLGERDEALMIWVCPSASILDFPRRPERSPMMSAHALLWGGDLDRHDRLEDHGPGLRDGELEHLAAGHLEGDVLGVDRVLLAVRDDGLDVATG